MKERMFGVKTFDTDSAGSGQKPHRTRLEWKRPQYCVKPQQNTSIIGVGSTPTRRTWIITMEIAIIAFKQVQLG
jgi:hypothetical protein